MKRILSTSSSTYSSFYLHITSYSMPSQTFDNQVKIGFKQIDNTELVLRSVSRCPSIRAYQV